MSMRWMRVFPVLVAPITKKWLVAASNGSQWPAKKSDPSSRSSSLFAARASSPSRSMTRPARYESVSGKKIHKKIP